MKESKIIYKTSIQTMIGKMTACATNDGICLLEFEDRPDIEKQLDSLRSHLNAKLVPATNNHLLNLQLQIDQYFNKDLKIFNLPLVYAGTDFQKKVWGVLLKIPYGKTLTYLSTSKKVGNVKAVRAVAAANGANKIAIVVPCHRVIGSDGKLFGYAGGLGRKEWLLNHESKQGTILF